MGNGAGGGGGPMPAALTPEQMQAQIKEMDKVRAKAKPCSGAYYSPQHGMLFVEGRGRLDIGSQVVAVPIPMLLQVVGGMMAGPIAEILSQIEVHPIDRPMQGVN